MTFPNHQRRRFATAALLTPLLLAGCATRPGPRGFGAVDEGREVVSRLSVDQANDVTIYAVSLVGTPYRYGGNTPEGGFDCSGLINYIYLTSTGVRLPRTSGEMAALDKPKVDESQLASGDLVFFGRGHVTHVGVYVGKGRFVHAPNSGGTVRLDDLDGAYWKANFVYGRRVLN